MIKAIIGSLDPSWISAKDLNYASVLIKASLSFYDLIVIDDNQLIDSLQMRYSMKKEPELLSGRVLNSIIFIKRKNTFTELIEEVINRKPPMIFSSLDYRGNSDLQNQLSSGHIDIEVLYKIFNDSDLRRSLIGEVEDYKTYIDRLETITSHIKPTNPNPRLFGEIFHKALELTYLKIEKNFETRSSVYNYISNISVGNFSKNELIRKGIKSLADLIYILNKSTMVDDHVVHIVFDSKHLQEIENGLQNIMVGITDILALYDKEIKIIKLKIDPVYFDNDIVFFYDNILPIETLQDRKPNFFETIEKHLMLKEEYDKLSLLKFIRKSEKYSRLIERKFPRFRSGIEITMFVLILIIFGGELVSMKFNSIFDIFLFILSIITTFDGILGFKEYISSRQLDTTFYSKIKNWYERQKGNIEEF